MKVALIGSPGSGKTTLFTAVTGVCPGERDTLKAHLGTVYFHDDRLAGLAKIFNPKKVTYAEFIFMDTHGLDLVSSRESDALIIVVGVFSGQDPKKETKEILDDIILADQDILERRIQKIKKEAEGKKDARKVREYNLLTRCKGHLDGSRPLRELELGAEEKKALSGFQLLTLKPVFIVANLAEDEIKKELPPDFIEFTGDEKLEFIKLCAKTELEILELPKGERSDFMKELGVDGLSEEKIINTAFRTSSLICFFTVKGDENRSWAIERGATALDAAGKVHTDIMRGFIKAEVIGYGSFSECGSFQEAKKRGLLRLEGKDYTVQDGDIINFKFNV